MKSKLLYIVIIVLSFSAYGQKKKAVNKPLEFADFQQKADSLYTLKEYEKSIPYFTKALEFKKDMQKILLKRGGAYFFIKDNEKAIVDFTGVISLSDKNGAAYHLRGLCKLNLASADPDFTPLKNESGCDDLLKAKQLGFHAELEYLKLACPDL